MVHKFEYDYNDEPLRPPIPDQIGWAGVPLDDTCGYAGVTPRAVLPTATFLGFDPAYDTADPVAIADAFLTKLNAALDKDDVEAILELMPEQDGWWRDVGLLTWDIRSLRGPQEIRPMLNERLPKTAMRNAKVISSSPPHLESMGLDLAFIAIQFEFTCAVGRGSGFARLAPYLAHEGEALSPDKWLAFSIATTLDSLKDRPFLLGERVPLESKLADPLGKARTYRAQRADEIEFRDQEPVAVVVGAGHCGLACAARLKVLGIPTLVIEKESSAGHSWSNRYASLSLHNPKGANHLPYAPYPETYPLYLPAQQLGSYLSHYAEIMDLNLWTESTIQPGAEFDEQTQTWTLQVTRKDGSIRQIRPKYLIIATGLTGANPAVPKIPGMENYKGLVVHSSSFRTGPDWDGKKVLVVGAATSAHDIAWELHDNGCEPTLLQRNSTHIFSVDRGVPIAYSKYMPGSKESIDDVDREHWLATAFPVAYELAPRLFSAIRNVDKELLTSLKKVGFKLNDGFHGTGALGLTNYRIGGYFFDTGCSTLVAEGKVKLKQSNIASFTESGVKFEDGSSGDYDVVVFCTGYYETLGPVRAVLGDHYADKVNEKVEKGNGFMIDSEGEARLQFKETPQENLWVVFQQFAFVRFHSLRLALKIAAKESGIDTTVYGHKKPEPTSVAEGLQPRKAQVNGVNGHH